jgi:hypothetical protein
MPMSQRTTKWASTFTPGGFQSPTEVLAPVSSNMEQRVDRDPDFSDDSDDEFTGVRLPQAVSATNHHYVTGSPQRAPSPDIRFPKDSVINDDDGFEDVDDGSSFDEDEVDEEYRVGNAQLSSLHMHFASTSLETIQTQITNRLTPTSQETKIKSSQYGSFDVTDFNLPSLSKKKKKKATMVLLAAVSDDEMRERMLTSFASDRERKKAKKEEREKLRAHGMVSMSKKFSGDAAALLQSTVDLRERYNGDEMDIKVMKTEIRDFFSGDALQ